MERGSNNFADRDPAALVEYLLVPDLEHFCCSPIASLFVSSPGKSDGAAIQYAPGRKGKRAHAHSPRATRYIIAERPGADVLISSCSQPAPGAHRRGYPHA